MEQEDPMYVFIDNPISFRKSILERAIHITEILKDYERYKLIREKKTKKLQELRGLVFDMKKTRKSLINSLPALPEEKEREEEEVVEKEEVKKIEKPVKIEPPKIHVSREDDDLSKELMEIEKKLRSL